MWKKSRGSKTLKEKIKKAYVLYIRLKKSFTEVKKSQWPKKEERKGKPNEDKKKLFF